MFYPVGHIMDRLGRKWAGIPSLLALSLALLVLPAAHELFGFIVVAILMGIGNGLAPGIVMTLGADFAPEGRRGEFLGVWRFISDAGSAGGPLAVSFIVGIASLAFASTVVAVLGLTGALVMWRLVPETLQRAMPHVVNTDEVASTSGKAM
jgi:MFS family permease